ncbi:MAG: hypothetical protein J6B19_02345, partial [Lachnospiraceae bacterium]|nr:hypothetical protein [Lachnospiraceae bacterium]
LNKEKCFNALKLCVAVVLGIMIANLLKLDYQTSAGIVAILTILRTKRETIQTAVGRALAFVAALLISFACFYFFGLTIEAYLLFFLIYIFVCHMMNWTYAITLNAVLVSHFVTSGRLDGAAVRNEVLIFLIGVGVGILMNLHLRKNVHHFEKMKKETDAHIIHILERMSQRMEDHDMTDYNGQCFEELTEILRDTKNMAEFNYNNQFNKYDRFDLEYIAMRERQCVVLYEMYSLIRHLETTPATTHKVSEFLAMLSNVLDETNDGTQLMEKFKEMDTYMKAHPLPVERQEFEDRARLFCFMRNMEHFIRIKMDFIKEHQKES